jgi:hypothetical protein
MHAADSDNISNRPALAGALAKLAVVTATVPSPLFPAPSMIASSDSELTCCLNMSGRAPHCCLTACSDSHAKGLYYTLRCFAMDFWDHDQGECAASSNDVLQTKLELASAQVPGSCIDLHWLLLAQASHSSLQNPAAQQA